MKFMGTLAGMVIIAATVPGAAPDLEGDWEGPLALDPLALTFEVSFSADGDAWGATLSVPAEGVRDVPIGGVELADNALTMTLTPQRTFRGAVDGDSIAGAVTFGDRGGMGASAHALPGG